MKIFVGILIGALCWGVTLCFVLYFTAYYVYSGSGDFISFSHSDSAKILAIVGAVLGIIIGIIVGGIILGFQLSIFKASLVGFSFNFLFSLVLVLWAKETPFSHVIFNRILIALLISGIICGLILSLFNLGQKSIE